MDNSSKRQTFLERIGFTHDPFQTPVAEQELTRLQQIFYSYYVPPHSPDIHEELLHALRTPRHTLVYGEPGSGKSTLRLTLEADCRTVLDGTLTITHILGEDIDRPPTREEHGERLARALAIDLTLAIIEQFNPLNPPPTREQIQGIQGLIRAGGRPLRRLLEVILDDLKQAEPSLDPLWGLAHRWYMVGKAPVKFVGASAELAALLAGWLSTSAAPTAKADWEDFWQGIEVARQWGFKQFFILGDGVDSKHRSRQEMLAMLQPLLEMLSILEKSQTFLKFFLPLELQADLEKQLTAAQNDLYSSSLFSIMIEWDEVALRRLLAERLRAACTPGRTPYPTLDSLAEPGFALEERVIQAARGSPRRLLKVVSDLIDAHLLNNPDATRFSQADWKRYWQSIENDNAQF